MHPPPPAAASAMDFSQNSLFGYMEDLQELTIIERPVRRSLKVIPGEGELPAARPPAGRAPISVPFPVPSPRWTGTLSESGWPLSLLWSPCHPKLAPLWAPSSTQPGFSQPGPHPRGTGPWLTSPLPRGSAPRLPSPLPQHGPQERPAETPSFRPVQRVPPTPPLSDSRGPSVAALLSPAPAELRFGAAAGLSPVLSWVPPSAAPWYCPGAGPTPQLTQPPLLPPPFPETPQIPPALPHQSTLGSPCLQVSLGLPSPPNQHPY